MTTDSTGIGGAFTSAMDDLYGDSNFGRDALYTPPGGTPAPVRVIPTLPDLETNIGQGIIMSSTSLFEVRKNELPDPATGGVLTVNAQNYRIQSVPQLNDPERLIWTLDCVAI